MGASAWTVELIKLKGDTLPTLFVAGGININAAWCSPCTDHNTQPQMLKNVNGFYANPTVLLREGASGSAEGINDFIYDEKRNKVYMASEGNTVVDGKSTWINAVYSADLSTLETKVLVAHYGPWFNIWDLETLAISNTMTIYGDYLEPRNRDTEYKIKLD
jgi:hypothetical protein